MQRWTGEAQLQWLAPGIHEGTRNVGERRAHELRCEHAANTQFVARVPHSKHGRKTARRHGERLGDDNTVEQHNAVLTFCFFLSLRGALPSGGTYQPVP
jgi:hypothetical protein